MISMCTTVCQRFEAPALCLYVCTYLCTYDAIRQVLGSFETSKNSLIKSLHRLLPLKNELDELQETLVTVCRASMTHDS